MDDEWNALEHYLLARATPADDPETELAETPVVVTIPPLDPADVPVPPVVVLGASPTPG